MSDLNVSLPEPCKEKWDDMAEDGCNRHCAVCSQTIHDLSKLTFAGIEELLAGDQKVCVRAELSPQGVVATADSGRNSRQIKAMIGASLGLAIAACQTGGVTPLYVISGQADGGARVELRGENGIVKSVRSDRNGRFSLSNLRSGKYSLKTWTSCGGEELVVPAIQVGKSNVDIGTVEGVEGECIVVGVMERVDPPQG